MPKYYIWADLEEWRVVNTAHFVIEAENAKHAFEIVDAYVNEPEAVYPPQTVQDDECAPGEKIRWEDNSFDPGMAVDITVEPLDGPTDAPARKMNEKHATYIGKIVFAMAGHEIGRTDVPINDPIMNIIDHQRPAVELVLALSELDAATAAGIVAQIES